MKVIVVVFLWHFQDARYYEKTSSELSETVKELTVDRDQLEFELKKSRQQCDGCKKQLNHMEQALEKVSYISYAISLQNRNFTPEGWFWIWLFGWMHRHTYPPPPQTFFKKHCNFGNFYFAKYK